MARSQHPAVRIHQCLVIREGSTGKAWPVEVRTVVRCSRSRQASSMHISFFTGLHVCTLGRQIVCHRIQKSSTGFGISTINQHNVRHYNGPSSQVVNSKVK